MPIDPANIEVIDDQMAEIYRRKSPAERLAIAHGMWRYARARLEAAVRWQHPDWDAPAVNREVGGRMLHGSDGTPELPHRRP
jgi:hypothetical protein